MLLIWNNLGEQNPKRLKEGKKGVPPFFPSNEFEKNNKLQNTKELIHGISKNEIEIGKIVNKNTKANITNKTEFMNNETPVNSTNINSNNTDNMIIDTSNNFDFSDYNASKDNTITSDNTNKDIDTMSNDISNTDTVSKISKKNDDSEESSDNVSETKNNKNLNMNTKKESTNTHYEDDQAINNRNANESNAIKTDYNNNDTENNISIQNNHIHNSFIKDINDENGTNSTNINKSDSKPLDENKSKENTGNAKTFIKDESESPDSIQNQMRGKVPSENIDILKTITTTTTITSTTKSTTTQKPCIKVSDSLKNFCSKFSSRNIQHQRCVGICS